MHPYVYCHPHKYSYLKYAHIVMFTWGNKDKQI